MATHSAAVVGEDAQQRQGTVGLSAMGGKVRVRLLIIMGLFVSDHPSAWRQLPFPLRSFTFVAIMGAPTTNDILTANAPPAPMTAAEYKAFRLYFEALSALLEHLQRVANSSEILAAQAARLLLAQHSDMAATLQALDEPLGALPDGWEVLSSDVRWHNRPKP